MSGDNTCVFASLAIYGHSKHQSDITFEFASKNGSRRCITPVCFPDLPHMVTQITRQTNRYHHRKPFYISCFLDTLSKFDEM